MLRENNALRLSGIALIIAVLAIGGLMHRASAAPIAIQDYNSQLSIEYGGAATGNVTPAVPAPAFTGAYNWTVDGVNHLYRQWYWFRVGPSGGEATVDTLGGATASTVDNSSFPGDDLLDDQMLISYSDGSIQVVMDYMLTGNPGGGNPRSVINETIAVRNWTASTKTVHFFQYNNFDINSTPGDDTVTITNNNTATQDDGMYLFAENVVTGSGQPSSGFAVGNEATLLAMLTDGSPTTLNQLGATTASGDVGWIFQWDLVIPGKTWDPDAGWIPGELLISKVRSIQVPEPTTLFGLGVGSLLLLVRPVRRKLASKAA